ncbi:MULTISPECIES: SDR family NAD(P)-dependent oxidoreductase [Burkholderia]|uniref:Short-chain dehydrogenase/reductase SDR n=1 Tax=Burkholderia cepacia TaxID=292 RepID=A0AAE8NKV5_BURCE|nr:MULTISPECIES: SDR family oxidoreductase [Burkholderia]KVF56510.1 short-chain dehydrogenase [Burkholderia cepacia]MBR8393092.1 SDR family oxidoreductase [Burkholderia cenocepacia]MBR8470796.1 SDR family oxidoreductase [Burkholderia cenocepacia]MBR8489696.1 SDR family oxidoreductase [Burkholderia cenocepacia]MBY4798990.1 SDR family oxidoreductase [Burkholderia cepacia]
MTRDCIVVTGASRGIGAGIALALAQQGLHVACLSRSGALPPFSDVSPDVSARWLPRTADVMRPDDLKTVLGALAQEGWRIVGLVNNAGLHIDAPSAELSLDEWHQVMDMNATSVIAACQAAYPHLVSAGNALIVNIGSFFDKLGVKRNLAYCASKAAVGAITRCLAVEWASKGIRVINIAPGYIHTDLNADMIASGSLSAYLEKRIPRGRPGSAEEIGTLVATLFAHGTTFLTGETIYVDGGQGIAH